MIVQVRLRVKLRVQLGVHLLVWQLPRGNSATGDQGRYHEFLERFNGGVFVRIGGTGLLL